MPDAASQTGTVSLKKKYGSPDANERAASQLSRTASRASGG
jgi:hypothetical protein